MNRCLAGLTNTPLFAGSRVKLKLFGQKDVSLWASMRDSAEIIAVRYKLKGFGNSNNKMGILDVFRVMMSVDANPATGSPIPIRGL